MKKLTQKQIKNMIRFEGEEHMTDLRKAAERALRVLIEADKGIVPGGIATDIRMVMKKAIKSLRQALSQPEQINETQFWKDRFENANTQLEQCMARTRTLMGMIGKKQWQNLTDDEIKEIVGPWGDTPIKGYTRKLFDQIEAKLRSKNT